MSCVTYFEVKSPKRGAKLRLDASFFVIGRGERIGIFHDDPSISREHAAIVIKKSGVRVRDLGSKNGVLLNGEPIGKYAEVDVKPGDSLKVGATTLVLHEGEPPVVVVDKSATLPEATPVPEPVEVEPPAPISSDEEDDAEAAPPADAAPPAPAASDPEATRPPEVAPASEIGATGDGASAKASSESTPQLE
jgi:pSer/pThr/pTyr-binding forkhead associated (FHA) protein